MDEIFTPKGDNEMGFREVFKKVKETNHNLNTEGMGDDLPVEDLIYNQFADRIDIDKSSDDVDLARSVKDADENIEVTTTTYEEGIKIKSDVENTLEYAKEVMEESEATLSDISDRETMEVEDTLSKYKEDLDIVDTPLDLATENIERMYGNKFKFERMVQNLEMIDKEIFINLEGLIAGIISGFGTTVTSLKKLILNKKSYIDSLLGELKSLNKEYTDDDKVSELYEQKFKGKGEPYYALYVGTDNAIVKYLESSLEELKQGNRISFGNLHEFDLPDKLKFAKKLVDIQAENDITKDSKTLMYDADTEIKYELHKITSCSVVGKEVEVRYAVKYNVGTAFHVLKVEVPAIDMPIDGSTIREMLTEASENTSVISGLLDKLKERADEIGKNYKEDDEEGGMFKKLLSSYVNKYEKVVDGYYDFIEATGKFYIREYQHADNKATESSIVEKVTDTVSSGASKLAEAVSSSVNSNYY